MTGGTVKVRPDLQVSDVIRLTLTAERLNHCISTAQFLLGSVVDRQNLHERDSLERFNNILMGEIAEQMVIQWLSENGKYVESSVDKNSGKADLGHDIYLKLKTDDRIITCSIKSSLSFRKNLDEIIKDCKLATTSSELREVNIQVYFWLELYPPTTKSRTTVISLKNSAIIGWNGVRDIERFQKYNHESRQAPIDTLKRARTMVSLLELIK